MASILLPTDFSDTSLNAAAYALRLFGPATSSFTLLHTSFDPAITDPMLMGIAPGTDQVAMDGMHAFEQAFRGRSDTPDIDLRTLVVQGPLMGVIGDLHKDHAYDAVVMGSRNGSGGSLFGTDVTEVIKRSRIPTITVPDGAVFHGLKHVLLANDGGDMAPGAFGLLLDLVRTHGASVIVLHVDEPGTTSTSVRPEPIYHALLGDLPHTFLDVDRADEVAVAIEQEAMATKADLVAVLHRHKGPIEGLFHHSTAKQAAMRTHVPLLVLHL